MTNETKFNVGDKVETLNHSSEHDGITGVVKYVGAFGYVVALDDMNEGQDIFAEENELIEAQATETPAAPVEETAQSAYEIDQYYYDTLNEKQFGNQPAQPLAELEALRAENAALKETINDLNIEVKVLREELPVWEKHFNALMAERNQLREVLKEAQVVIRKAMIAAEPVSETLADEIANLSLAFRLDFVHSTLESE